MPRHRGLDVGRVVFSALNTVECALAFGLVLVHFATNLSDGANGGLGFMITLVALYIVQALWFYPCLELRGKYAICQELNKHSHDAFTPQERAAHRELQVTVRTRPLPSVAFHVAYVLGEVVKVVLLTIYSMKSLQALTKA